MPRALPILYHVKNGAMVPDVRYKKIFDKQFAEGSEHLLILSETRDRKSHNHFMAAVHSAWMNLAEEWNGFFPTEDHLRKWALVKEGFCTKVEHVCHTSAEAARLVAAFRDIDQYAVISKKGNVVLVFQAESQSELEMGGGERWRESKKKVLDRVASMSRTTPEQLKREASQDAPPERK